MGATKERIKTSLQNCHLSFTVRELPAMGMIATHEVLTTMKASSC